MRRRLGWHAARVAGLRQRAFRSLAVANYRLFFIGHAVSVVGTWMQRVAQDWLVLDLSDSAMALGIATALQFLPTLLFGLVGGVVVDRFDRRRIIIVTQTVSGILASLLAAVALTGVAQLWMVYALALGLGLVTVVDTPARQAFVTDLVAPDDYVNAQSLNSTIHNLGRFIGPAVAGILIAAVNVGVAFAINAVSFVAVLIALAKMDTAALRRPPPRARERREALAGLAYVWRHDELRACIILVAVVALVGQNFRVVLPILARDTLGGGPEVYGWLTSALGIGAVVGALGSAARERVTAGVLVRWAWVFAGVSGVTAVAPGFVAAMVAVVGLGVAHICFNTLARTLLQIAAAPEMQGRVIGLHSLVFLGTAPIGGPITGWVCERWGAPAGLALAAVTVAAAALAVTPTIRRIRRPEQPDGVVA